MKRFIILSAMTQICCLSAMAYPAVGDRIVQVQTVTAPGGRVTVTEITKELGASTPGTFVYLKTEKNLASGTVVQDVPKNILPSDVVREAQITEILRGCRTLSGNRELVQIGSNSITTCRITLNGTTVWYAHVPFGVVKVTKDYNEELGGAVETVTRSFQFGK